MKITSSSAGYCPAGATTTLVSGAGKLYHLAASCTNAWGSAGTVTLYDNTAGSGTVILVLAPTSAAPVVLNLAPGLAISFASGLTVVCSANTSAHVIYGS